MVRCNAISIPDAAGGGLTVFELFATAFEFVRYEVLPVFENVLSGLRRGDTPAVLLLALLVLTILLLFGFLMLLLRLRRLAARVEGLTAGADGVNLEETLTVHLESVAQAVRRMEILEQSVAVLQAQVPRCYQRASMVRYDAFEDVGGEQSFSLALLDAQGDGLVLTSVYSRTEVRVYAKSVQKGLASHALSHEEERALRQAAMQA